MGVASSDSHGGQGGCWGLWEPSWYWVYLIWMYVCDHWKKPLYGILYQFENLFSMELCSDECVCCVHVWCCCCTFCCLDWRIQDICDSSCCFTWVRTLMQWPIPWRSIWISYMWCLQVHQQKLNCFVPKKIVWFAQMRTFDIFFFQDCYCMIINCVLSDYQTKLFYYCNREFSIHVFFIIVRLD